MQTMRSREEVAVCDGPQEGPLRLGQHLVTVGEALRTLIAIIAQISSGSDGINRYKSIQE